jgi:ribonuclease inhibitor
MSSLVEVNLSAIHSSWMLHVFLAEKLGFPGYYGMNWDAFRDCLGEIDSAPLPSTLRIVGWEFLRERLPRDAALLRQCLDELQATRPECHVEWAA